MNVTTRQQLWKDMGGNVVEKQAELAGTYDMPNSPPGTKRVDRAARQCVGRTGRWHHLHSKCAVGRSQDAGDV